MVGRSRAVLLLTSKLFNALKNAKSYTIHYNYSIVNVKYLPPDMKQSYSCILLKSGALLTVVQYESGKQAKADGR